MRSPIKWLGSKTKMVDKILKRMPEHKCFCEAFGGSAALLFAKPRKFAARYVEVYNDVDLGLVNLYRVLQDSEKFNLFVEKVEVIPYARSEYHNLVERSQETNGCEVDRAAAWFAVARQSFAGKWGSAWGFSKEKNEAFIWANTVDGLWEVHNRLKGVIIESLDWRKVLDYYDGSDTFFYLDPPYVLAARDKTTRYDYELSNEDHEEMVSILKGLDAKVLLSGYPNEIYDSLGWQSERWDRFVDCRGRTRISGVQGDGGLTENEARVEVLWRNFDLQMQLFS